jgi:hypothetical protein
MNTKFAVLIPAVIAVMGSMLPVELALADQIEFDPGTYHLSSSYLGSPTDTLVVSVAAGVASFVLTGADSATFSISSPANPTGYFTSAESQANPYFQAASLMAPSWNSSTYPYVTFFYDDSKGGLTVGTAPGDAGTNLIDLFQSSEGSGQVFTAVAPLPAALPLFAGGLGLFGFLATGRKRKGAVALLRQGIIPCARKLTAAS